MDFPTPDWFVIALLTFAAARTTRLLGWDTITEKWRVRWTGYNDDGTRNRWPHKHETIATLLHCPYCSGVWTGTAWYAAWWAFPTVTLFFAGLATVWMLIGVFGAHIDKP